jgi:hypothetical protein
LAQLVEEIEDEADDLGEVVDLVSEGTEDTGFLLV